VPAQLPTDVVSFTGRHAELARLDQILAERDGSTAVVVAAITGTAGVGKTALALHWAHRVRDRFRDGQVYVNLHGHAGHPAQPAEILARFLRALGVGPERIPSDVDEAAALYRTLLADRSVLLVLDNARDAAQVQPLLPGSPSCLVVVTSRDRLAGIAAQRRHRIALPVLAPEEAGTLIDRIVGEDRTAREPDSVARLAAACACLPLALRIAAARLSISEHRTIADYVAELDDDRLDALDSGGGHDNAVRAAFEDSYQRLSGELRRLFRFLGVIPGPDFTPDAVAALVDERPGRARQLLDRLADAHLIEQPTPGRYAFHDLLRLYAKELAHAEGPKEDPSAAYGRLLAWQLRTEAAAGRLLYPQVLRLPAVPGELSGYVTGMADHAAAVAWLEAERANLVAVVISAGEYGHDRLAGQLADGLRGFFRLRHHPAEWLSIAAYAVDTAVARRDLWQETAARLSLGSAYHVVGAHRESLTEFARGLAASRECGWRDGEAAILGAIGWVYRDTGKLQHAASHLSQALAIYRQTARREGQANHLCNLGLVYLEVGRLREATELLVESLALHEQTGSRSGQARTLDVLGDALRARGRLPEALIHLNRAAALHGEVGDQEGRAGALTLISAVHCDAGRLELAAETAGAALTLAREAGSGLAEGHAVNAEARVLLRLGRPRQALGGHAEALRLARVASNRYLESCALTGMAEALLELGELDQAAREAAAAMACAGDAGLRLLEAQALGVRAEAHRRRHEHVRAVTDARAALALHRDSGHRLGEAQALLVLADALAKLGDPAEADARRSADRIFAEAGASRVSSRR
jgi:tetratricopeptide (TPR) repeat protein